MGREQGHPFDFGSKWVVIRTRNLPFIERLRIVAHLLTGLSMPILRHKFRVDPDLNAQTKMNACLAELVSIQYFDDQKHKHRAWAWDAIDAVDPDLAQLCSDDPKAAFDLFHGD